MGYLPPIEMPVPGTVSPETDRVVMRPPRVGRADAVDVEERRLAVDAFFESFLATGVHQLDGVSYLERSRSAHVTKLLVSRG